MSIDKYFAELELLISSFFIVSAYNLNIDRKTVDIAFISGIIEFRDGTTLDFKEFIDSTRYGIEKYKYAYNYRMSSDIIFRYDNAPDPMAKRIKTFPHHKHIKSGEIIESKQMDLRKVLEEIETIYNIKE
ncbi:MAG: DUF6516 family protein [Nitrospirota bacterium]